MGNPKKTSKHYDRPLRLWDKENLEKERILKNTYGLKNKRELWRVQTTLSKKRKTARQLLAVQPEQRAKKERELLDSLAKLGLVNESAALDDVLTLSVEAVLERRLQTIVWRKGLANSPKQARQFIVHGHIAIKGKKVSAPSYLVLAGDEEKISYYGKKMQLAPPVKKEKKKPTAEGEADESTEGIETEEVEGEQAKGLAEGEMALEEVGEETSEDLEIPADETAAGENETGPDAKEGAK